MRRFCYLAFVLLLLLTIEGVVPAPQQESGATSDSFSLLASNLHLPPARLKVYRGQWAPLLRQHLPISKRVLRGGRHVCRIEMEELAPIFSVVGHLEPKVSSICTENNDFWDYVLLRVFW